MTGEEADRLSRAFQLQRDAVDDGRHAVWQGLLVHREVDETVLSGLEAQLETGMSGVEMGVSSAMSATRLFDSMVLGPGSPFAAGMVEEAAALPLETFESSCETAADRLLSAAEAGVVEYEGALVSVVMSLNRRIIRLMAAQEALEERIDELGGDGEADLEPAVLADARESLAELDRRLRQLQRQVRRLPRSVSN